VHPILLAFSGGSVPSRLQYVIAIVHPGSVWSPYVPLTLTFNIG
jgi:hypothetical protein